MKSLYFALMILFVSTPSFSSDLEEGPVRFTSGLNVSDDGLHRPIVINEAPPTGCWQRLRHSRVGYNLTNAFPSMAASATALGLYVSEIARSSQIPHDLIEGDATHLISNFQGNPVDWIIMVPQLICLTTSTALPFISSDIRYKRLHQFTFGQDNNLNRNTVKVALITGTLTLTAAGVFYAADLSKYVGNVSLNLIESLPADQATRLVKMVGDSAAILEKTASAYAYKSPVRLEDLKDLATHHSGHLLYVSEIIKNTSPSVHFIMLSLPLVAILLNLVYAIVLF